MTVLCPKDLRNKHHCFDFTGRIFIYLIMVNSVNPIAQIFSTNDHSQLFRGFVYVLAIKMHYQLIHLFC